MMTLDLQESRKYMIDTPVMLAIEVELAIFVPRCAIHMCPMLALGRPGWPGKTDEDPPVVIGPSLLLAAVRFFSLALCRLMFARLRLRSTFATPTAPKLGFPERLVRVPSRLVEWSSSPRSSWTPCPLAPGP